MWAPDVYGCPQPYLEAHVQYMQRLLYMVAKAIETSTPCKLEPVPPQPSRGLEDATEMARVAKLAEAAKASLPRPLRTLLTALHELKRDITEDGARQRAEYEDAVEAKLQASVAYTVAALEHCASEVSTAIAEGTSTVEPQLKALGSQHGYNGPSGGFQRFLQQRLAGIEAQLHTVFVTAAQPVPVKRSPQPKASVPKALSAVDESKAIRERLAQLAEGPLSSLFEQPAPQQFEKDEEDIVAAAGPAHDAFEAQASLQAECQQLKAALRSLRRITDGVLQDQSTQIDDALMSCAAGIAAQARGVKVKPQEPLTMLQDMREADTKLQAEIKLVLETLTVDLGYLDQYLRHVSRECTTVASQSRVEAEAKWAIRTATWKSQVVAALDRALKACV